MDERSGALRCSAFRETRSGAGAGDGRVPVGQLAPAEGDPPRRGDFSPKAESRRGSLRKGASPSGARPTPGTAAPD